EGVNDFAFLGEQRAQIQVSLWVVRPVPQGLSEGRDRATPVAFLGQAMSQEVMCLRIRLEFGYLAEAGRRRSLVLLGERGKPQVKLHLNRIRCKADRGAKRLDGGP